MKQLFNPYSADNTQRIAGHTLKGTGARNDGSNSSFRLKKNIFMPLLVATMTVTMNLQAQVRIGEDRTPESGALLDLNSTFKGGLLLPTVEITDLGRIPDIFTDAGQIPDLDNAPQLVGLMVYDTNCGVEVIKRADGTAAFYVRTPCVRIWDGKRWQYVGECRKPLVFMAYNLGADPLFDTPKKQMQYLANHAFDANDATVYGGLFQWGRKDWEHAVNTAATPHVRFSDTDNAQDGTTTIDAIGQPNGAFEKKFIYGSYLNNNEFNWYPDAINNRTSGSVVGAADALWGNGLDLDGQTTTVAGNANPCPAGWRVPTQDEWEMISAYDCNPSKAVIALPTSGGTAGTADEYNPDLIWVPVVNGKPDNSTWSAVPSNSSVGGYALYFKIDWEGIDATGGAKAYAAAVGNYLYDPACPSPLLFLPAAGSRDHKDGSVDYTGSDGYYWSSTVHRSKSYCMYFRNTSVYPNSQGNRALGLSVRCVAEE
jgi:hypothetical protein